jgi:hypothetical protein
VSDRATITLTPQALAIIASLGNTAAVMAAVASGLDLGMQLAQTRVVQKHLTGKGPYLVEEHRLGERTHTYRKSVYSTAATVRGTTVSAGMGANVKYAALHEFGGRISIPPRKGSVRLRTDKDGNLLRQASNEHLAVFARATHKRARTVDFEADGYEVEMPARAPVSTGIMESLPQIGDAMSDAIIRSFGGAAA